MQQPARYHAALVTLHWLLALLVIMSLSYGVFTLERLPNSSPAKIDALRGHMIAGAAILALTLLRIVVRALTAHPPPASTGMRWADRLAQPVHWLLYLLVLTMAGSGFAMAIMSGLGDIVFGGRGALPESFDHLPPRAVHGLAAKALMLLVALHIAAALYHEFARSDGLLARMGYGKR